MPQQSFIDFDLVIEKAGADAGGHPQYHAQVVESPAGEATGAFVLPFSDQDIKILLLTVGRPRGTTVRRIDSPEMAQAKDFGGKLFDTVFNADIRTALLRSLDEATRQNSGLRLRLRLNAAPELADLPWEYLYNSSLNRFLALSVKTPIIRFLDLPEAPRSLHINLPLRILAMISSPSDYDSLDVEDEWKRLNDAVSDLKAKNLVVVDRLDKATLGELRNSLRQTPYHILHFVGHGGFDEQQQDGVLVFEDENGRGRSVTGQTVGALLQNYDSLRLVVLNACEGARTSRSDPFSGVASSLVQQGLSAVIAMQFEISDNAALTFAREFYAALADGDSVDAAVGEARTAIFSQVNDLEWGTPVLYLRAPDGVIFTPTPGTGAPDAMPAPATPVTTVPAKPPAAVPAPAVAESIFQKYRLPIIALGILVILGLLGAFVLLPRSGGAVPEINISSPPSNTTYLPGEPVTLQVSAADPVGIAQLELLADDSSVDTARSPISSQTQFSAVLSWLSPSPGSHLLTARATNARGGQSDARINIIVAPALTASPFPPTVPPTAALGSTGTPTPASGATGTPTPASGSTGTPTPAKALRLTTLTLAVLPTASTSCPQLFRFQGTIAVNRAGTITYQWVRSDRTIGAVQTLNFNGPTTTTVRDSWTLNADTNGWEFIQVLLPVNTASAKATFTLNCPFRVTPTR